MLSPGDYTYQLHVYNPAAKLRQVTATSFSYLLMYNVLQLLMYVRSGSQHAALVSMYRCMLIQSASSLTLYTETAEAH